jgi:hypothetical protein
MLQLGSQIRQTLLRLQDTQVNKKVGLDFRRLEQHQPIVNKNLVIIIR